MMKTDLLKNRLRLTLSLATLVLSCNSNAQTFSDYTQVGTFRFDEFPLVGSDPPVAKLFDTDFAGKWLDGQLFRVNEVAFNNSTDIATVSVQANTLLTPRGGPFRTGVAQGTSVNNTTENSTNTDMFNASFWCIGSLDDGNSATDDRASATFSLPTVDLQSGEFIEWTVWVSPDSKYPNNLVALGGWGIETLIPGNSMFDRDDVAVFKGTGDSITILNDATNETALNEGNMSTFWLGARVVPEPSSVLLSLVGFLGLIARRQR